jgi:Flp pilus assembly protein TadG
MADRAKPKVRAKRSRAARRRHRKLEGAAAVEFALILPLFSVLLMGLIDFGHFFFTMNTINNAAREAARRASVQTTTGDMITEGTNAANTYLAAAGLSGANCPMNCPTVTVTPPANTAVWNASVRVTITIPGAYRNITGFSYRVLPGFNSPFSSMTNLQSVSDMRWELAPNP